MMQFESVFFTARFHAPDFPLRPSVSTNLRKSPLQAPVIYGNRSLLGIRSKTRWTGWSLKVERTLCEYQIPATSSAVEERDEKLKWVSDFNFGEHHWPQVVKPFRHKGVDMVYVAYKTGRLELIRFDAES
jgi:hypothetical protein